MSKEKKFLAFSFHIDRAGGNFGIYNTTIRFFPTVINGITGRSQAFSYFSKNDILNNIRLCLFLHAYKNIIEPLLTLNDLTCVPGKISKL